MVITYLNLVCIIHFIGLGLILYFKKDNTQANKILSLALFTLTFTYIDNVLAYNRIPSKYPTLIHLDSGTLPLFAPLFYFYILSMTGKKIEWNRRTQLHFIPAVACFILLSIKHFKPYQERINYVNAYYEQLPLDVRIYSLFIFVQLTIYLVLSAIELHTYSINIKNYFSDIHKINLTWLFQLIILITILTFTFFPTIIFFPSLEVLMYAPIITASIYITIVYKSLTQPIILSNISQEFPSNRENFTTFSQDIINEINVQRSKGIHLSEEITNDYVLRVSNHFKDDKPYLDSALTIKKVSDKTKIPVHHLSWIFNEKMGNNFFDYVNQYRVEEAKAKLKNRKLRHLKIEHIAFDCGFNSKATFNRAFKKYCNVSPSEYQKSHLYDQMLNN